ncbi:MULTISPECIES: hypothetical protein [Fischerella]|uniref:Uncharacterized protein n=1 Tax=Fischerella muscicola CCMEE 5323 TaxID=2019572 RepID=A0A2N6JZ86_FISMU|nr:MULTISPECIES: hypothetical protein [Fischerella]MBD2433623.1 hypothetical protein [Fischerella sp. FACHB-380]PLZ86474.1 hypothetical protein CEN44_19965 [Fischerella muscicola CCMEE 5323]
MKTSLRTTSVVLFFIGVALIILKMADTAWMLNDGTVNHQSSDETSSNLISLKVDSQSSKHKTTNVQSSSDYEPPNYGGPDSPSFGSGTR